MRNLMPDQPHPFSRLAEDLIGDLRGVRSRDPRRSRVRPTLTLGEETEKLMVKYGVGRSSPEQTIRDHWVEIVGSANASYSHPVRLERNMLTVIAGHAVVRNELFLRRETVVERIRQLPGCAAVKALNIRAG